MRCKVMQARRAAAVGGGRVPSVAVSSPKTGLRGGSSGTALGQRRHARNSRLWTAAADSEEGAENIEVVEAVEDFERINRPKSKWFGGVDCNHIFFEGLWRRKSGAYGISWGS